MNNPKISVITVCLNSEKTIRRTIDSVYSQNYDNWNYYIIDGKSTDKTLSICEEYRMLDPSKMTIVSEKDNGIYDAMNKGINMADGDIIAIINSDDWYEPQAFKRIVRIAEEQKRDDFIIYGMCHLIRDGVKAESGMLHPVSLKSRTMYHPAMFITKSTYQKVGNYNTKYKIAADYDLMLRCKKEDIPYIPLYRVVTNFPNGGASECVEAYYDLLRVKRDNNMISSLSYYKGCIKYWYDWKREEVRKWIRNKRKTK